MNISLAKASVNFSYNYEVGMWACFEDYKEFWGCEY